MKFPKCDNDCVAMGWVEYTAEILYSDLHISVPPDSDFDDTFLAFCHDGQEMLCINGSLVTDLERVTS